jgi:3-isopropylmalate dehydratase small subunit
MLNAHVIYRLGDGITAQEICPFIVLSTLNASQRIFYHHGDLNFKFRTLAQNQSVAIVCGNNFGCGTQNNDAVNALTAYNLTIIAKSISADFLAYCGDQLKSRFIQNSDLRAGVELGIDDIQVDDELQIQTFKVIKRVQNTIIPGNTSRPRPQVPKEHRR